MVRILNNLLSKRILCTTTTFLKITLSKFSSTSSNCAFDVNEFSFLEEDNSTDHTEFKSLRTILQPKSGGLSVFIIHPYIKWGPLKKRETTPELQLSEAVSLVDTLHDWDVVEKETVALNGFCNTMLFGSGKLDELKRRIDMSANCTGIFINIMQLTAIQHQSLESFFGKPIYDRFLVVMQIFREHAFTKEAKLQIALAELPYLYSRMSHIYSESLSRIGGAASVISGTTIHTPKDTKKLLLHRYEKKVKNSLRKLKTIRGTNRTRRKNADQPIVAVVGYTNAGKTSLVKLLTGNEKLIPKNCLFATLDVTFHLGRLPCNLKTYFIDTIGFFSDIPTHLLEPFRVTLEDALEADVIVHIQDISHPEWIFQRNRVNETLESLNIEKKILKHVIPVANKIDLIDMNNERIIPSETSCISCRTGEGIDNLKLRIEDEVIAATGRLHIVIRAKTGSEEYEFLRKEAAVADVVADKKDPNYSLLSVILTENILDKFKKTFITI